MMETSEEKIETKVCRNCGTSLSPNDKFCPACSQKYTTGRIPIFELITTLISTAFNLDSKLFKTMFAIFIPGKLTNEYFKGKHKSYAHPIRMFLVLGLLHFATVNYFIKDDIVVFSFLEDKNKTSISRNKLLKEIQETKPKLVESFHDPKVSIVIDSLINYLDISQKEFFNFHLQKDSLEENQTNLLRVANTDLLKYKTDSLLKVYNVEEEWRDSTLRFSIDSIRHLVEDTRFDDTINVSSVIDWGLGNGKELKVAKSDLYELEMDSLLVKYEYDKIGFFNKLLLRQSIKVIRDGDGFGQFMIGQMLWAVLIMMPMIAFVLMLLYWRRKHYYVEHLIFSLHCHAFTFLIFSILYPALLYFPEWLTLVTFIGISVYLFFSMKNVYKQGYGKTFVKFALLNAVYLFVFVFALVLLILISLTVF